MRLARVIGRVIATIKDPSLQGCKLLLLKHVNNAGSPTGDAFIALDSVGAGAGELVYYVGGKEAALPFSPPAISSDATIVGIVDSVSSGGSEN